MAAARAVKPASSCTHCTTCASRDKGLSAQATPLHSGQLSAAPAGEAVPLDWLLPGNTVSVPRGNATAAAQVHASMRAAMILAGPRLDLLGYSFFMRSLLVLLSVLMVMYYALRHTPIGSKHAATTSSGIVFLDGYLG